MQSLNRQCLGYPPKLTVEEQIQRGVDNADIAWKNAVTATILKVASNQDRLTAADIRKELKDQPVQTRDLRALGGMMRIAKKQNIIEKMGLSKTNDQNNRTILWHSRLYLQQGTTDK